jgi:hypothetical protein
MRLRINATPSLFLSAMDVRVYRDPYEEGDAICMLSLALQAQPSMYTAICAELEKAVNDVLALHMDDND